MSGEMSMTTNTVAKTLPERGRLLFRLSKWALALLALAVVSGCATEPFYVAVPSSSNHSSPVPAHSLPVPNTSSNHLAKASAPAAAESFVFRPGDVVVISFPGSPSLNTTQRIRTDGKISLPLIGEAQAAGLTVSELQKQLRKLYAPQLASNQVMVEAQNFSFSVYVTGAVLRPGKVSANHPLTALDAIMEAGGFNYTTADTKGVVIIRQEGNGTKNYKVNLKSVLRGKKNASFYLKRGDIIYVPQRFTWF